MSELTENELARQHPLPLEDTEGDSEEDISFAKQEQEDGSPEATDENIPRKDANQSLFDRYRKISEAELTKEQRLRIANLLDAFGMSDVIYYEHMIFALEYYLSLNTKEIREHASIVISDRFLDNLEVKCKDAIRRTAETMEEEISSAGSLTQQLFELTNDTLPAVNKAIQDFEAVPSKIERTLSEYLTTVVEKQLEAKKREVQWFESIARNSVFIFGFGFFGIFFFVAGLLSYGAGFPPWIAGILGEEKGLGMIASVAFGLPMSWTLWIGGGFLSLLWLYEHRKLRLINELVAFHMMSYVIGGVIVFLLMWWLL